MFNLNLLKNKTFQRCLIVILLISVILLYNFASFESLRLETLNFKTKNLPFAECRPGTLKTVDVDNESFTTYVDFPLDATIIGDERNIQFAKVQPEHGKNVFFIESKDETVNVTLTPRQSCAIESAALVNPHLKVFVLYAVEERFKNLEETEELKAVLSYPNVYFNYLNATELSKNSPLEKFIQSDSLSKSKFKVVHTSDILRFLFLWKYGGTYLDTDMVVRQRFDSLTSNFACPETKWHVNNAFMNFENGENGRRLAEIFIEDLVKNYNATCFACNGPMMLTRVLHKVCKTNEISEMVAMKYCDGFHVYPKNYCYALSWDEYPKIFNETIGEEELKVVNESIVIHLWNQITSTWKIKSDSKSLLARLAKKFCPKTMAIKRDFF
jgi:lactosylceramide 4-alpha-galactosyltransferase